MGGRLNYLFDTAVLIYLLEDRPQAKAILELLKPGDRFGISFVTAAEFFAGAPSAARKKLFELLERQEIPLYELAGPSDAAALAETKRRGRLKMPDAMVLQTAIRNGLTLLTADRDFAKKARRFARVETIAA